jgi:hypothetical protein
MPRLKIAERATSTSASKSKSGLALSVTLENRLPDDWTDFVTNFAGGSADRANDWLRSQVATEENNEARALIRDSVPEEGETKEAFGKRIVAEAHAGAKVWDCVSTRKKGTGVNSRAKDADKMMTLDPRSPEFAAAVAEYRQKYGIKK